MASFADYTKKKKKKEQSAKGVSFTDYTKSVLGKNDIEAPTYKTYKVSQDDDIAPVKTTSKKSEERTWFKESKGGFWQTVGGTLGDIGENLVKGISEMPEKIADAGMMLGAAQNRSAMMQAADNELIANAILGKETEGIYDKYSNYQDEVEKETAKFVAKDIINTDKIDFGVEDYSVLGEKSDALVQSTGQLGATAVLQAVGVPWWLTTGASTFGAEGEAAFNQGATFDEAMLSSTISAGAEILTEKISGGINFGGSTLDDVLTKELATGISNKVVRTLVKFGLDASGEGFEEILSGVMGAIGQKLTYADDKEMGELFSSEEAFESFIGGAVLGGGSSAINIAKSNKSGVDYVTGLNENEQKVVDKVYESEIAEAEADGKKLTQKEKKNIYDRVLNQMEEGEISTDTIEEVLGGETYSTYKSTVDNENALKEEFDTLNKMKQGEMTGEQIDRRAELKQQLEELKNNTDSVDLKTKLGDEVFSLVKDSRLVESYNEKSRRGQAFEADLSQYDTKYQETIKKAAESGILNNTRRTHKFVDMLAKISADKGVLFDFTNNEKIANSSFAVEGKIVNGYVDGNGNIALNIDSPKALNSTVGHEITHILEGTELYDVLQTTITEYAKSKGEYDSRLETLTKLYEGVEGANVDAELTADLVGDYLFTDTDFIHKLSTEHRNVFEKIYDEIKYLCKVATAGSKEARELERVKKAFEDAYRESGKTESKGETKHSISGKNSKTADNSMLLKAEQMLENGTDSETVRQKTGWYKGYDGKWRYEIDDSEFKFYPEGRYKSPDISRYRELTEKVNSNLKEMPESEFEEWRELYNILGDEERSPYRLVDYIEHKNLFEAYPRLKDFKFKFLELDKNTGGYYDNRLKTIVLNENLKGDADKTKSALIHEIQHAIQDLEGFAGGASVDYWQAQREDIADTIRGARENLDLWLDDIGYPEFANVSMQEVVNKEKTLEQHWKDCQEFKDNSKYAEQIAICEAEFAEFQRQYDEITKGMTAYEQYRNTAGEIEARDAENRLNLTADERRNKRPDIDNPNVVFVNTKYSLSTDSEGTKLSKGQQEYFKDSKMRDDNGNLKVMYHGSEYAGFHEFNSKFSDDDKSFFFVDSNEVAQSYSGSSEVYTARSFNTVEEFNQFFEEIDAEEYEVIKQGDKYALLENGDVEVTSDTLKGLYDEFCDYTGLGQGQANYKVYLNLTNPLEVDAEGRNWNRLTSEFSQEIYDRIKSLTEEEKTALTQLASWEDSSIFRDEIETAVESVERNANYVDDYIRNLASAAEKLGDIDKYRLFDIATDNFTEETLKENAVKYLNTREYAQRAKEQGYDGVIFKNIVDNGGYSNGKEGASTVAIAFDSNQIKSVANSKPTSDADIRYSLTEYTADEKKAHNKLAVEHFGKTYSWNETGYLLLDGTKLDFSGKHEGAPGGYRTVDHRDISDALGDDYGGDDYSDALIQFMSEGNIRIIPEMGGINLSVKPTQEQAEALARYISNHHGEVVLDIDNLNGDTVVSVEYPYGTQYGKVINDIRNWFDKGEKPQVSNLSQFRYSLSEDNQGNKLSKEQSDYFKDSKVVDENGGLKVVYHGTRNADFTIFKKNVNFFTDSKEMADSYSPNGEMFEGYLNITKPYELDADGEKWSKIPIDEATKNFLQEYGASVFKEGGKWRTTPADIASAIEEAVDNGDMDYDGIIIKNIDDTGSYYKGKDKHLATDYIVFNSNQFKNVDNKTPTNNPDITKSLSEQGAKVKKQPNLTYGKDIRLENDIAPIVEESTETDYSPIYDAPITEEQANAVASESLDSLTDADAPPEMEDSYYEVPDTSSIDKKTLKNIGNALREILSLTPKETKAIQEVVQEYSTSEFPSKEELFGTIKEKYSEKVWKEKNDEVADVKRWLRSAKINVTQHIRKGIDDYSHFRKSHAGKIGFSKEGIEVDSAYQELNEMYPDFFPADIVNEVDQLLRMGEVADMEIYVEYSDTLDDDTIQEAVNIVTNEVRGYKDNLAQTAAEETAKEDLEDIAPAKVQQVIDRATNKDNSSIAPINTVEVREAKKLQNLETELADNKQLMRESLEDFDREIERISQEYLAKKDKNTGVANNLIRRLARLERLKSNVEADYSKRISDLETRVDGLKENVKTEKKASILTEEPTVEKKKSRGWEKFKTNFLDKQSVFETLSLKTKNRDLQAKANFMRYSEGRAQNFIGKGAKGVEALTDIQKKVESAGHTQQLYEYMYHKHNVDRMTLADRFDDVENKPVFGDYVTADISKQEIAKLEKANPKLKEYAESIYKFNKYLRNMLVEGGVISQETADLWEEMYPHYVPVRRVGESGLNINVALDTTKTTVNAPVKRATGGNSDILPLFDTMAQRAIQTFKAVDKNSFGVELKNTLGTTIEKAETNIDEIINSVDNHEELLQEGKNGLSPTFTVFDNGERVTFEITEDMYDALRPVSEGMAYTNKILKGASSIHRGVLTEYNPTFMFTNAIKDIQDVLINSQHPARTYANIPKALAELVTKGKWYNEYIENGGEQNTYFDKQTNTFDKGKSGIAKVIGFPLEKISDANNFIEKLPRLAEYIASRKAGRSVEVAMLDSARVTTNFAAGGDVTKFLNRNGATFLNASVQGALQQVRNVREAKANGLKGWLGLATKLSLTGLSALLLNGLLWDDDEDYEELSDYVKDNYYIVGKYGDGQFVRIPKGRTSAVIQNAFQQVSDAITGDDELDFNRFFELFMNNIAPNNPIDNNIIAPITQAVSNKTWYGDDLVPTRLQDLPSAEQYDESTDTISKWLGEKLNLSPYKINYLLNQYSGGVGDVVLPMLTPEAESGDNSFVGNLFAPLKDKFTTDSTMNNQNVSDFYDTVDELTVNANSSTATDEDILKYKYMNSINADLGELYAEKRNVQNSTLYTDAEKYNKVRAIQESIDRLAENSLNTYNNVFIDGNYAEVGDLHYRVNNDGDWQKITDKQLEKQEEVTSGLGISGAEYWSNKEEYNYAYENPEKYAIAKSVGGYETYKSYTSDLYDIRADKDSNGDTIIGSAKEKKIDYINNLDLEYGQKIILLKSLYKADDTYNYEIIDYLNEREDISYEDMVTILKELDFEVDKNGNIYWD